MPTFGAITKDSKVEITIRASITDADVMPLYEGKQFQPTSIEVTYRRDGDRWKTSGNLHGPRIRKDGSHGAQVQKWICFWQGEDPRWVTEFVQANMPTEEASR